MVRLEVYRWTRGPGPTPRSEEYGFEIHPLDPALQGNHWEDFVVPKETEELLQQFVRRGFTANITGYKTSVDAKPEYKASLVVTKDMDERLIAHIIIGEVTPKKKEPA